MALIVSCPRCTSCVGIPAGAPAAAQLQCPLCETEFSLAAVVSRELPQARVVEAIPPTADTAEGAADNINLSRLLRSTANWQPQHAQPSASSDLPDDDREPRDEELPATFEAQGGVELSASPAAPEDLQLGPSRLDQLLSDLIKQPDAIDLGAARSVPPSATAEQPTLVDARATAPPVDAASAELTPPELLDDRDGEEVLDPREAEYAEADQFEDRRAEIHGREGDHEASIDEYRFPLRTAAHRRRPTGVRTLVGVVGGGILGLLFGAYGLLWLHGDGGDYLGMSNWLPAGMLPPSMRQVADASAPSPTEASEPAADQARPLADAPSMPAAGEDLNAELPRPSLEESSDLATSEAVDPSDLAADRGPIRNDAAVSPAAATEPLADEPAAPPARPPGEPTTIWPTTPLVGELRNPTWRSLDELSAGILAADDAHRQFLAGDLANVESRSKMGGAYMEVCSLAEKFTLTDPADYGNALITQQMMAKNIFRGMAGSPDRRGDLAVIAARWLQHDRRQNQGALILGRVRDIRAQGPWTEYEVVIPAGEAETRATLLVDKVSFSVGEEMAAAGVIVQEPREQISGYQGDAAQVIIVGYAFAPTDFVAPVAASETSLLP